MSRWSRTKLLRSNAWQPLRQRFVPVTCMYIAEASRVTCAYINVEFPWRIGAKYGSAHYALMNPALKIQDLVQSSTRSKLVKLGKLQSCTLAAPMTGLDLDSKHVSLKLRIHACPVYAHSSGTSLSGDQLEMQDRLGVMMQLFWALTPWPHEKLGRRWWKWYNHISSCRFCWSLQSGPFIFKKCAGKYFSKPPWH